MAGGRRILVLQHHPLEHPGVITGALTRAGAGLDVVRLFEGIPCPRTLDGYDGLIAMGGPMGANDDLIRPTQVPWLADERALLQQAIAADLPTLGVCLGSQLLAAVAGATVAPGPVPEIGWYRIAPTVAAADDPLFGDATSFTALEWHHDAFSLPRAGVALASSATYPIQAFRVGRRVYGLLFHLEVDPPMVEAWRSAFIDGAPLPAGDAAPDFVGANRRAVTLAERLFLGV